MALWVKDKFALLYCGGGGVLAKVSLARNFGTDQMHGGTPGSRHNCKARTFISTKICQELIRNTEKFRALMLFGPFF